MTDTVQIPWESSSFWTSLLSTSALNSVSLWAVWMTRVKLGDEAFACSLHASGNCGEYVVPSHQTRRENGFVPWEKNADVILEEMNAEERRSVSLRKSKSQRGEGRRENKSYRPLLVAVRRLVLWTIWNTMKKKGFFFYSCYWCISCFCSCKKHLGCFEGQPRQLAWMEWGGSGGFAHRSSVGDRRSLWVVANKMSGARLFPIVTSLLSLSALILCVTLSADPPQSAVVTHYIAACFNTWGISMIRMGDTALITVLLKLH